MGSNVPATLPELITWCNTHKTLWQTNATAIGLTSAQAEAFTTLVDSLTGANDAAQTARQASKDATMSLTEAANAARGLASAYVSTIKGRAQSTNNPNVYVLAGVSPDAPPGTVQPPVAPDKFTATVNANGSLTIKWKVSQPAGVTGVQYVVSRRVNSSTGPFAILSMEGSNKSYTDNTLPVGVDKVEYIVQPKRSTVYGPQSNVFALQFGTVPGGGMTIVSSESAASAPAMKMAA